MEEIMTSKKQRIKFGERIIDFELIKSKRKTLSIIVKPDLKVLVKAPENASNDKIKQKVHKKATWIIKQKNYFQEFLPLQPEKRYVSGESFKYLGKQYRLKVYKSKVESVKLKSGYINIYTPLKNDKLKIKNQLDNWYSKLAFIRFEKRLTELFPKFKRYTPKAYTFKLRKMKNRWGSCTPKGKISINPNLIKASSLCIDYVLIHELCHLVIPNHSSKFYDLLTKMEPNWVDIKNKLERTAHN